MLQTLSSFAWLAVIVIQAFIHFVVGPKYTAAEVNDEPNPANLDSPNGAQAEEIEDDPKTNSIRCSYTSMETIGESFDDGDTSLDGLEPSTISSSRTAVHKADMDKIDPDECDSVDENLNSGIQDAENTKMNRSSHISENDLDKVRNKTMEEIQWENSGRKRSISNPELHSIHQDDDCIDEDEEWRYNLIKDYYATSYYHMMSASATNMDEMTEEDDPALVSVGTINTLSEKLRQKRRLSEINLRSQRNTRNVTFDHSPVSVIATY